MFAVLFKILVPAGKFIIAIAVLALVVYLLVAAIGWIVRKLVLLLVDEFKLNYRWLVELKLYILRKDLKKQLKQ